MLFNKSLCESRLPQIWKDANITPIHKKGPKSKAENYRPISLTSIPCKLLTTPLQCKTISLRPHAPWYTSALRQEKRVRRRGERVAARTMLEVDRQIVQDMYKRRNEQLVEAKTSYFTKKVEESKDNPKALFRLTRNMMGNSGETILPLHTCKRNMANDFSAFFYNKILNIRSELGLPGLYKCGSMTTSFSGTPLTTFMDATEVEIRNIIKLSPAKSCELDPLPTWLLKECIAELVPTITDIVNIKSELDYYLRNIVDLPCQPGFNNSLDGRDCLHGGHYADDLAAK